MFAYSTSAQQKKALWTFHRAFFHSELIMFWLIVIFALVALLFWWLGKRFKNPKTGALCVTTGGLKTGKSSFSLYLAKKTYRRNLLEVKFKNFVRKVINKLFSKDLPYEEEPLFYSTIPVAFPHVRLTLDLIMRKKRFRYKSVVWVDEATLLADSQLWRSEELNARLLEFCKLFGHETKGGCLFFTSHCLSELHASMRRASSEYFYVHSLFKWLPFFMIATIREERYSEDGTAVNVYENDVEEHLRRVVIPKSVWKEFDCYCYSILTDHLPVEDNVVQVDSLKAGEVVSFNPLHRYDIKPCHDLDKGEDSNGKNKDAL